MRGIYRGLQQLGVGSVALVRPRERKQTERCKFPIYRDDYIDLTGRLKRRWWMDSVGGIQRAEAINEKIGILQWNRMEAWNGGCRDEL